MKLRQASNGTIARPVTAVSSIWTTFSSAGTALPPRARTESTCQCRQPARPRPLLHRGRPQTIVIKLKEPSSTLCPFCLLRRRWPRRHRAQGDRLHLRHPKRHDRHRTIHDDELLALRRLHDQAKPEFYDKDWAFVDQVDCRFISEYAAALAQSRPAISFPSPQGPRTSSR